MRPVDGTTGMALRGALEVSATGARILRNRSGLYVIQDWSRLATHTAAFDAPPDLPVPGSELLEIVLRDPIGRYLPRRASIALPRDPGAIGAASLFVAPFGTDCPNVSINCHHTKSERLCAFPLSSAKVRPKKLFHSV